MKLTDKKTLFCIITGLLTLFFTGGHWDIPVMAWIFPVPLLIISRNFHKQIYDYQKSILIPFIETGYYGEGD